MHLYKLRKTGRAALSGAGLLFLLILILGISAFGKTADAQKREEKKLLAQAIQQAVVSCYAIEGRYPESLSYLEEHYGVQVDEERYLVRYEVFAQNIRPNVSVIEKGADQS